MESGTATTIAPMVTSRVPTMSGKIPNKGGTAVGAQVSPKRKGMIPTSTKIGYPSRNRKRRINVTTTTAKDAVQKNRVLIARSLRNDKREVPSDALRTLFTFFMTFTRFPQKEKNMVFVLSGQAQPRVT
jgi:hypothetical protein